mmetsp:Transcript_8778/g.10501  ORF Transcript_8778/g.10501 Transcript_8778/m.10501 type:complete len:107 (-) Transcript_8778:1339-1659(-)
MVTLEGDITLQQLLDQFSEDYNFEIMSVGTTGDVTLYNDLFGQEDRVDKRISELYYEILSENPPTYIPLVIDGDFEEVGESDTSCSEDGNMDEWFAIPPCRLKWSK